MNQNHFERLFNEGLISSESLQRVKIAESNRLFSVHWEVKTILYLGVLLLSSGLGILIYKNINTIGHQAVLAVIALLCGGCFYYAGKHRQPFSWKKVNNLEPFADYAVLLGCLLAVTFIAYLQAQYEVFGTRYGLASFPPMVILFFCAYYFDHLGVLSLGITTFAGWLGVTITPYHILSNDFGNERLIWSGLMSGAVLIGMALLTRIKDWKAHFSFTYLNFGMNIFFIATLAAMFSFERQSFIWLLVLAGAYLYIRMESLRLRSFYLALMASLYGYVGTSFVVFQLMDNFNGHDTAAFVMLYFILSAFGVVVTLVRFSQKIRKHDGI